MKVKDLIAYLSSLDAEYELLFADYYYEDREGFVEWENLETLPLHIVAPENSRYSQNYQSNCYLVDLNRLP